LYSLSLLLVSLWINLSLNFSLLFFMVFKFNHAWLKFCMKNYGCFNFFSYVSSCFIGKKHVIFINCLISKQRIFIFLCYSLLFCIAIQDAKLMLWILTWKVFFLFLLMFGCYFSDRFWWVFRRWRSDGAGIWFWETWGWEESENWVVAKESSRYLQRTSFLLFSTCPIMI